MESWHVGLADRRPGLLLSRMSVDIYAKAG